MIMTRLLLSGEARRLIGPGGRVEGPEAKRLWRVSRAWYKAEKEHITGMVYVQEIKYPGRNIRHRSNTGTILGTWPHSNTNTPIHLYVPKISQFTW